MAIKKKLTKAEYEKLSDDMKKHYKAGEFSDTFVLDTGEPDEDDPAELRRALAREREDKRKAQRELRTLKEAAADEDEPGEGDPDEPDERNNRGRSNRQDRRGEADAKKLDADWLKKYNKDIGTRDAKLAKQNEFIKRQLINGTAETIAAKISTSPKLLANEIAKRLTVDFEGDDPELVILGTDGKAAGLTLDKLEKEFRDNKEYASIIIGSKASGGGTPKAGTDNKTGDGVPASDNKTDLSKLSGKALAEVLKARKADAQQ